MGGVEGVMWRDLGQAGSLLEGGNMARSHFGKECIMAVQCSVHCTGIGVLLDVYSVRSTLYSQPEMGKLGKDRF